jgi:hypothetical protein
MATEPTEPVETLRNAVQTIMDEYHAAIDAAIAADRAGDRALAYQKALSMAAIGEVMTGMLTVISDAPAMGGALEQLLRTWHEDHEKNVARLAHLRQIN